ncbi:hypothetical protein C8Q79DRAFT_931850 [Trametes meyenii]|nr:hypothetical protein C8Q79DRAFT_931850 [Trametes meyenii]
MWEILEGAVSWCFALAVYVDVWSLVVGMLAYVHAVHRTLYPHCSSSIWCTLFGVRSALCCCMFPYLRFECMCTCL